MLKKNPEYVILYNLVGSAYQNSGAHSEAKNFFEKGLKLDHNNIAIMNNLAMTYKYLLQYELAEELYLKIISINNKYLNAFINLGNLKRDINQFEEAIKLYEKALIINDNSPIVYYSLALAHQGIGNFEKAINLLQDKDKNDFYCYVNSKTNYNPHIMFIAKPEILENWFGTVFPWLERCEKIFGFENLTGYETTRIYAYLAERYLPFWFKKYTKSIEWPWSVFENEKL